VPFWHEAVLSLSMLPQDRKFYGETYLHANKQIMSMYINMKEMEEAEVCAICAQEPFF